jgi:hypothetical protein
MFKRLDSERGLAQGAIKQRWKIEKYRKTNSILLINRI